GRARLAGRAHRGRAGRGRDHRRTEHAPEPDALGPRCGDGADALPGTPAERVPEGAAELDRPGPVAPAHAGRAALRDRPPPVALRARPGHRAGRPPRLPRSATAPRDRRAPPT